MRIIPKNTRVSIEFFKGVSLPDIIVGMAGFGIIALLLMSNIAFKVWIIAVVAMIFVFLLVQIDSDKTYMFVLSVLKHLVYKKKFAQKPGKDEYDIKDFTSFTGIADDLIKFKDYYGAVIEIPPIEFRFFSENRQNSIIDRVFANILQNISENQSINLVKVDRPMNLDKYIEAEKVKIQDIKNSFVNGLLSEEELNTRIEILLDRTEDLKWLNSEGKVIKAFHYLIIYDKDPDMLKEQIRNANESLRQNDMDTHVLDTEELAVFLKYNYGYDFDEREISNIEPEDYMSWILPEKIEITGRSVKYDDLQTFNLRIIEYPMMVANAWGHQLFNIPDTKVVMKMHPVEKSKAIRRIDRAIDELRGQESSTGKTSRLIELSAHIETLANVLVLLQNDNELLLEVNIFITVYDRPDPEEEGSVTKTSKKKKVRRLLQEDSFKSEDMFLRQVEAYIGQQISAYDPMNKKSRAIHSTSVAATFPFVYSVLNDDGGIYLGHSGGFPVFVNFFKRDSKRVNSNMVIIGKSGSGKSYATKMILSNLAAEDSKVFILDPENEYSGIAKKMNGKVIDVGSARQGRLNPFHIVTSIDDTEDSEDEDEDDEESIFNKKSAGGANSFVVHLQFLEEFFRQILPELNSDAAEQLNNIFVRMYELKGIDQYTNLLSLKPEDFPTFDDLYDKLLIDYQGAAGEYSKTNLRILMNYISKFAYGGRNSSLWNGPASITTNENFVVFNFQSLLANKNNTIANAQMLLVLKWLDNEIIKNRDYNIKFNASRKIIIVIDEAHVFIDSKYPVALDFMFQLAKRIRKYNGMQIVITQNIKDFVGSEEIARKSTAIINACQYSFIFSLAPNDMHDLCKLYEKAGEINETEQEEIINNPRGNAFVVTGPTSRSSVQIVASPEVEALF